jgi:hypothetical protein
MLRNRIISSLVVAAAIGATFLIWWYAAYDRDDPHSMQYFLWKQGYHTEDMQSALAAMADDPNASAFVKGKTPDELRKWFPLETVEKTAWRGRSWYENSEWAGKKALFVTDCFCMIAFDNNNRAEQIVFMKF